MANRTVVPVRDAHHEVVDLTYTRGFGGVIAMRMDGYYTGPQFQVEGDDFTADLIPASWIDNILGVNVFVVDGGFTTAYGPNGSYVVPEGASMDVWHPAWLNDNPWSNFAVDANDGLVLVTFYVSEPVEIIGVA